MFRSWSWLLGVLALTLVVGCSDKAPIDRADAGYSGIVCSGSSVDPRTDSNNCGRCNNRCYGDETCTGGTCQAGASGCTAPHTECGSSCVDLASDPSHCGDCDRACGPDQACSEGDCDMQVERDAGGTTTLRDAGPVVRRDAGYECDYETVGDCPMDQWCASGFCRACDSGRVNCDLRGTCECESTCEGDRCAVTCTRADYDSNQCACGGDSSMFCTPSLETCRTCSDGFYNCDLIQGCESDTPCDPPPSVDCP